MAAILATSVAGCDIFTPLPITTNVAASDGEHSGLVRVSWDPHRKADSYKVYRSAEEDGVYSNIAIVTVPGFDDLNVVEGIVYWYKVQACNKHGCSDSSLPEAGYVKPAPPPAPPD